MPYINSAYEEKTEDAVHIQPIAEANRDIWTIPEDGNGEITPNPQSGISIEQMEDL